MLAVVVCLMVQGYLANSSSSHHITGAGFPSRQNPFHPSPFSPSPYSHWHRHLHLYDLTYRNFLDDVTVAAHQNLSLATTLAVISIHETKEGEVRIVEKSRHSPKTPYEEHVTATQGRPFGRDPVLGSRSTLWMA